MQFLVGALLAALIAGAAWRAHALTRSGALSAWIVGTVIFGVGGWAWGLALVVFFVSSSALSRWRRRSKEALGFEKTARRDAAQVWANGGAAVLSALLPLISSISPAQAHLLFLASVAAATADTWATEIGAVWGGQPRDLRTGRRVRPGTSGAISAAGTAAALLGSLLLGAFAGRVWGIVTLSGMVGALLDSVLGATVQAHWSDLQVQGSWTEQQPAGRPNPQRGLRGMNNDWVNFFCTFASFLLCLALTSRFLPF